MMKLFFQRPAYTTFLKTSLALFMVFVSTAQVTAQVRVVEAGASSVAQPQNNNALPASSESNDIVINLYLQLESLQEEVQTLRGVVEEQSYQIRRMQTESRNRYLDIDTRLAELLNSTVPAVESGYSITPDSTPPLSAREALVNPAEAASGNQPQNFNGDVVIPVTASTALPVDASVSPAIPSMPENEQDLYRTAFNLLIEDSSYEDSIITFQQYINVYPDGRYLANAYYWQGEALILVERYNQAKEAFMIIINEHSEHSKAPGAMLKLVVTYIQMDDVAQARQALQDLRIRYPDSLTEIGAAEDYLTKAEI